jgi:protein SCO1/2
MDRRRLLITWASLAALALAAGCGERAAGPAVPFKGVDITGADYGRELALPDVDGRVRTLADFKGKAVVVFFGFTHCPDVCPTTMAELADVKRQLGADGERLQAVFVTVDPERDTPEKLKGYMAAFDPSFVALRGTPAQTEALAKSFKAYYKKVPGADADSYTVDHTAGSYVFDPQGRLRLFVRYGQPVADWVSDLRQLLA